MARRPSKPGMPGGSGNPQAPGNRPGDSARPGSARMGGPARSGGESRRRFGSSSDAGQDKQPQQRKQEKQPKPDKQPKSARAKANRSRQPTTTKVAVELPPETAAEYWLRTFRLRGFTLLVLGLVVLTVVVLAPSLRILVEQQHTIAVLQAELEQRRASVEELEENVARWDDPAYIEAQARERLYYVYPGEFSYIVIDDVTAPTTPNGVPISDEIQTTQVDWVKSILSSLYTAGLTEAGPEQLLAPVIEGGE